MTLSKLIYFGVGNLVFESQLGPDVDYKGDLNPKQGKAFGSGTGISMEFTDTTLTGTWLNNQMHGLSMY